MRASDAFAKRTCAPHLLENGGVPESTRKELLGHERPRSDVTWRYTHGAQDTRAMVLAALGDRPEPRYPSGSSDRLVLADGTVVRYAHEAHEWVV